MSTEEINQETAAPETAAPPTPDPETPETPETENDVSWNDVPDPEDENDKTPPETGNPDPAPAPPAAAKPSGEDGSDQSDKPAHADEDPFSFLNDLDNDPDAPPATPPAAPPSDKSDPSDPSDKPDTPAPAPADNSAPAALDGFDIEGLINELPDGELKDFADNYHEETKMAAAITLQILKKLGYDRLQTDVKNTSEAAVDYGRMRAEIMAETMQREFERAVTKIHPDAAEIISGKDRALFAGWLKNQPKFLQKRFRDSSDPEEAADIITRFKESRGIQRTEQRKRNAMIQGMKASGSVRKPDTDEVGWNDIKDEDVPEY